ncbi:MAG: transglycosylase SLT domain-containing protein [Casimicrobiaceae bacterium]
MPAALRDRRVGRDGDGWTWHRLVVGALLLATDVFAAADPASSVTAAPALMARALAYEHGEGVPKDQPKAAELYCDAARAGDADAMFNLGWMYANGRGVTRDDALAAAMFARSAQAGHTQARRMLDVVGEDRGVIPDCMRPPEPEPPAEPVVVEPDPFADLSPAKKKIADMVAKVAPRFTVSTQLALAVIAAESNFDPGARSHKDARGLMQLIPATALRFKVRNSLDATENVQGGLAYLRWLLAYYEGEVSLVVAAYNAGEAAVDKYKGVPPYAETRDYVRRVQRFYPSARHPYDANIVGPSSIVIRPATDTP